MRGLKKEVKGKLDSHSQENVQRGNMGMVGAGDLRTRVLKRPGPSERGQGMLK